MSQKKYFTKYENRCCWYFITKLSIIQIIKLLKGDTLKNVNIAYNHDITQFGWKDILNALSKTSMEQRDISSNTLGRFGVAYGSPLMSLAGAQANLLNLSGSQLTDDHVDVLSAELRNKNTRIAVVKVEPGNNLTDENISMLQAAAYNN